MRYSAFGLRSIAGDVENISNPWCFAGKREVASLSLFAHRFYNPLLMRWQTTDPLGFKDGLNLYAYVHNRPFYYKDPDGQFAVTFPLVTAAFGAAGLTLTGPAIVTIGCTVGAVTGTGVGLVLTWAIYQGFKWVDNKYYQVKADQQSEIKVEEKKDKDKIDGKRKRLQPDSSATGEHTTIKRDPDTGEITHYETYKPQTNPRNPNPWESEKRYDGPKSDEHWNKELKEYIYPPHIHDSTVPGGLRPAQIWEIPS